MTSMDEDGCENCIKIVADLVNDDFEDLKYTLDKNRNWPSKEEAEVLDREVQCI